MNSNRIDIAALMLRTTLGLVLVAHGLQKFLVFTLPGTAGFFASVGLPGWAAYIVAPLELAAGVALLGEGAFSVRSLAAAKRLQPARA